MLPTHMKLTDSNIIQIDQFRCVGVRPPQILELFACSSGGYDKIHYRKKDIHNQIGWQRREHIFDASTILKYLKKMGAKYLMFVRHIVDTRVPCNILFWCDGESQLNIEVFGDVLTFDATYRKNKELEVDFDSKYGKVVMQTSYHLLECFAS
ncbi:Protein FAR1-RELATED SEQUENCE 5 [Glycine max]|nr:Protein FAR1-RELATED SEQUENCE 5 [Glycine max]